MASTGNLRLYFVPGISIYDEPVFTSKNQQAEYFFLKETATITEGFYVPHFRDKITFDTTTFSFNSLSNYLSIEFGNRVYYYFIESIEYISEDIVEVTITMDVIQTYMLDLKFYKYERTRKLIQRWVTRDNKLYINRDYLRENLSQGLMQLYKCKYYNGAKSFSKYSGNDVTTGTIVIKQQRPANNHDSGSVVQYQFENPYETNTVYYHFFIPMVQGKIRGNVTYTVNNSNPITCNDLTDFNNIISENALVKDVYYLPFSPFNFESTPLTTELNSSDYKLVEVASPDYYAIGVAQPSTPMTVRDYTDVYSFGFSNTGITHDSLFNVNNVPAMVDENYINIFFGEYTEMSTYPLYQVTKPEVSLTYVPDVIDGSRIYCVSSSDILATVNVGTGYNFTLKDPYGTAVRATNVLRFDIMTDAYQEWYTYNKGALVGALVQTVGSIGIAGATGAAAQGAINQYGATQFRLADNGDKQTLSLAQTSYRRSLNEIQMGRSMGSAGNGLISWAQEGLNASMRPAVSKQTGNVNGDRLANTCTIIAREYRVNDFDEVARYYETSGYKVHEIVYRSSDTIVLPWARTRYYYDVISINNISFSPIDSEPNSRFHMTAELEALLRERFEIGFRGWHCYTTQIGGYVYSYIEGKQLTLGSTCVYDNTEV